MIKGLFYLFPLLMFGQQSKCFETINEIETHLKGKWVSDRQESKTIYEFWFEEDQWHLSEYETYKNEEVEIENSPFIELIKTKKGFELQFTYLTHGSTYELKCLNEKSLIISIQDEQIKFEKID